MRCMNIPPPRTGYILRVQRQGRRLWLELVDLRSGEVHRPAGMRALWQLLSRLADGLR